VRYLALVLAFVTAGSAAEERAPRVVPRVILAVYDSHYRRDVRDTRIHQLLEMPLNHLGLVVRYQDRNRGLPAPEQMRDVRGILTWFRSDAMQRPTEFLSWATAAIDAGKRFVVIGDLSGAKDMHGQVTKTVLINGFFRNAHRIGQAGPPRRGLGSGYLQRSDRLQRPGDDGFRAPVACGLAAV
jgi:polysaccharide biosynthesis protein PelA